MTDERKLPEDPLAFIQACVRGGKVLWTYHVNMRLENRFIPRQAVLNSVDAYELIESYPHDKYLPSYLVFSQYEADRFHILFAADSEGDNVRIVTAYRPDPAEWSDDMKRRRSQP